MRVTTGAYGGIHPARDGGFWFYGSRDDSAFTGNYKPYIMRYDSSGNKLYDYVYPDSGLSVLCSVFEDSGGNLVTFGYRQFLNLPGWPAKGLQCIFSLDGRLLRRRYFDLDNRPSPTYSIGRAQFLRIHGMPHPNGGYVIYGNRDLSSPTDTIGFIGMLDSSLTQTKWLHQTASTVKLRVLTDGSIFVLGFFYETPSSLTRKLTLRRYDSTGVMLQDYVINTSTGSFNGIPYVMDESNYEFAGDSSVILVGAARPLSNLRQYLPMVYIAKIGGFPNPYTILSLPADQPLVRAPVVYPNPFQDQLTISGNGQPGRLLLFDRLGKQVYEGAYTAGEPVSLQGLPSGFYFYRFHGHSGGKHWSYGGKVLKQ